MGAPHSSPLMKFAQRPNSRPSGAPMQPRLKRFMPLTTRQMAAKSRRFCWKAGVSGCTTCGLSTVKGTLYWENTSVTENLPQ